jgi:hypothetical protein
MSTNRTRRAPQLQQLGQQQLRILEAAAFASFGLRVAQQHGAAVDQQLVKALQSTIDALSRAAQLI